MRSIRQVAALPYRKRGSAPDAPVDILLVTSRETKRWVIPKGNPMMGFSPHAAAAMEAEEEAGIRGAICPTAVGSYRYLKKRRNGASRMLDVDVFPLAVAQELDRWKEHRQRQRHWFSLAEAADAVEEQDLAALIRTFDPAQFEGAAQGPTMFERLARTARVGKASAWLQRLLSKRKLF